MEKKRVKEERRKKRKKEEKKEKKKERKEGKEEEGEREEMAGGCWPPSATRGGEIAEGGARGLAPGRKEVGLWFGVY